MRFETDAVHAGTRPDPTTGAVMPPIHPSSTFAQDEPGVHKGFDYSRTNNPTRSVLEAQIAALEGGKFALAFASGMAAADAVLHLLSRGDHVVAGNDLYGGTRRILTQVYERLGIRTTYVDARNPNAVERAVRPETKLAWLESPTNPLLRLSDLAACAAIAHGAGALCLADNTFATPYLQRPLDLGADIVLESTTKYLGGHSDVVGGALAVNDPDLRKRLAFIQNAVGGVPSPFDCWLVLRGIKTLALRVERGCANATALAGWLAAHEGIRAVHYPGLESHPQHDLAKRQMKLPGAMVSFELEGDLERAKRFVSATRLFTLAESLGGVESLIEIPALMTHASIPADERRKAGLPDALIRLSVGIEAVEDLREDLERALAAARG
ncbi:MAG: cystathionine gamma-synthase [Planctomycetes bacterium]|nr:cystathionine gamma-synthase [Planctomycetota bacterium]